MDIESDESERWEDFFGSSTDLAPSVFAYYDRLSSIIDTSSNGSGENSVESTFEKLNATINTSLSSLDSRFIATQVHQQTLTPTLTSKNRNFRVLSHNVQRIISNSNSTLDNIENSPCGGLGLDLSSKPYKKVLGKQRHPVINIPLSKNICKIAQSGSELVDSLETNYEKLKTVMVNSKTFDRNNDISLTNGLTNQDDSIQDLSVDQSSHDSKLLKSNKIRTIVERLQSVRSTPTTSETLNTCNIMNKDISFETDSNDEHFEDCIAEANNFLVSIPPEAQLRIDDSVTKDELNDLKKLINEKSNSIFYGENETRMRSLEVEVKETSENQNAVAAEPAIQLQNEIPSKLTLTPPEVSRITHRPLSSSSICSTSSTSSSGSERLAGKLGVSYLASVESLADESELGTSGLTQCERACMEMVDSEKSYVEDLRQVIKGYLTDWREGACLRTDELKVLFSNIEEVYAFNSVLLAELVESELDPERIAKCFIRLKDRFDVYTSYCTSYPEAISLLTSLLQASHTNALLASTQKMLRHTLPLGSYLLKPVQRILKYHLLLDNLRKHCDVNEVSQAHVLMKQVASYIDQVKRNLEQLSRVKELSGILDGWLGPELTVLGDLKLEGLLMENNKPRIVLLFQTMLIITKKKEDKRLQFKTYIHCKNLMLIEHLPGEPTSFNVIPYDDPHPSQIKLTAKNRDEKREWAQQIKQVMLEHFDIPNRAKELVFKLGDEEDRTPDKNTWKWGTPSSSTRPEYLERRNQYRRSELRYRSKKQRKSVTASISMEGFDRKNSEFYTKTPSTQSLQTTENAKPKVICNHSTDGCTCKNVKEELSTRLQGKNSFMGKESRNRSKSEPRIFDTFSNQRNQTTDDDEPKTLVGCVPLKSKDTETGNRFATLGRSKSKVAEIKSYNTKTLPKRIVNLKKQKSKTKETFKFYMDLPSEDTVLRITESSENLTETKSESTEKLNLDSINKDESPQSVEPKEEEEGEKTILKRDVEIISDLLKANKDFEKILNKPPKKKSFDSDKLDSSHEETSSLEKSVKESLTPTIVTNPVQEVMKERKDSMMARLNSIQNDIKAPEPIYESLLRNVHVPYKFSPVLSRSLSQQNYKFIKPIKTDDPEDAESDYVTLVYTESGNLKCVLDSNDVPTIKDEILLLRNSDSNINYNKLSSTLNASDESGSNDSTGVIDRRGSFNVKSSISILQRFISLKNEELGEMGSSDSNVISRMRKSSVLSDSHKLNRMSERRISDVSEMCRQNFIHKQGSESLGSRIAHLDYADPKTLFTGSQSNILINKNLTKPQRDSVFSLTSSSDSVNDTKTPLILTVDNTSHSYYEKNVEDSLENDGVFRDSAIYSDDNERKLENIYETPTSIITSSTVIAPVIQTPPTPPPRNTPPKVPKKPIRSPPPLPTKPIFDNITGEKICSATSNGDMILQKECNKSWVSQQIKNFDK